MQDTSLNVKFASKIKSILCDMRSIFTIATGSEVYLEYAFTLARSFLIHHPNSSIKFFIVTDLSVKKPNGLENIGIVKINQGSIAPGISSKLFLDKLAPTEKSLFIDSDCLCFRNLESLFSNFDGHAVSVVGFPISIGEWCGALSEDICRIFNVSEIPRFNGGIYYIEKSTKATEIYDFARSLESQYDELGFSRHRGWCNEEPLMSIAIAKNGESAIIDDGTILSDLGSCLETAKLDVISGKCLLTNPASPDPKNKWWYQFHEYSPAVIHFSGGAGSTYPYVREKFKLSLIFQNGVPTWLSQILSFLLFTIPFNVEKTIKNKIRPIYRVFFGYRKIKYSDRPFKDNEETG